MSLLSDRLMAAKQASRALGRANSRDKNAALHLIARGLQEHKSEILSANDQDLSSRSSDLTAALRDRIRLNASRLEAVAAGVEKIAGLKDPVGEVLRGYRLPNGLFVEQRRVPLGVIGAVYEARPNVTVDMAALALKSGNACVLRGGSAAINTNESLVRVMREALEDSPVSTGAIQSLDSCGREGVVELMRARGLVDVLIPRGSKSLIDLVVMESKVPVIETGAGLVHVFLDASAREQMAVEIVINAKTQRTSVCNAAETLLVHEAAADRLLPRILYELQELGVILHGCPTTCRIFPASGSARSTDWAREYLALEMSVRVVADLDAALEHIRAYSTGHTEVIVTEDMRSAERFIAEVDSAAVIVNASSRFIDGGEFGFGAEAGISTQKLHARGPMGLLELTSTKWILRGDGQVRG